MKYTSNIQRVLLHLPNDTTHLARHGRILESGPLDPNGGVFAQRQRQKGHSVVFSRHLPTHQEPRHFQETQKSQKTKAESDFSRERSLTSCE